MFKKPNKPVTFKTVLIVIFSVTLLVIFIPVVFFLILYVFWTLQNSKAAIEIAIYSKECQEKATKNGVLKTGVYAIENIPDKQLRVTNWGYTKYEIFHQNQEGMLVDKNICVAKSEVIYDDQGKTLANGIEIALEEKSGKEIGNFNLSIRPRINRTSQNPYNFDSILHEFADSFRYENTNTIIYDQAGEFNWYVNKVNKKNIHEGIDTPQHWYRELDSLKGVFYTPDNGQTWELR